MYIKQININIKNINIDTENGDGKTTERGSLSDCLSETCTIFYLHVFMLTFLARVSTHLRTLMIHKGQ